MRGRVWTSFGRRSVGVLAVCLAAAGLAVGGASSPAAAADPPTVSSTFVAHPDYPYVFPTAVSESGRIVGGLSSLSGGGRGFVWTEDDGLTMLEPLPGDESAVAIAITEAGVAYGVSSGPDPGDGGPRTERIVAWSPADGGTATDLGVPDPDARNLGVADATESGYVLVRADMPVGSEGSTSPRGFLWSAGAFVDLGDLGAPPVVAVGINEAGTVTGWAHTPSGDRMEFVRTIDGNIQGISGAGEAVLIDDAGRVYLNETISGSVTNLYVWSPQSGATYFPLFGGPMNAATALSPGGVLTGSASQPLFTPCSWNATVNCGPPFVVRPFIWTEADGVVGLPAMPGVPAQYPFTGVDVSDTPQVVGTSLFGEWSWTEATGYVTLPGSESGTSHQVQYVTNDGMIVGTEQRPDGQVMAIWRVEGGAVDPDADGDGVDDAIDTGDGTFTAPPGTSGSIVSVPAGLTVTVTDALDPAGVRIIVGGSFDLTERATVSVCGYTATLSVSTDATFTCGSVLVGVAGGDVVVDLGNGDTVTVPVDAVAKVDQAPDGSFVLEVLEGEVDVLLDGIATTVAEGTTTTLRDWRFTGFARPVDPAPTVNTVQAGRTVPLTWRLTDPDGVPVTDLTSVQVRFATRACDSSAPLDEIEQTASGASGLQNLGDGYYQFNWKTPRTPGTCGELRLDVGQGVVRTALFRLR